MPDVPPSLLHPHKDFVYFSIQLVDVFHCYLTEIKIKEIQFTSWGNNQFYFFFCY